MGNIEALWVHNYNYNLKNNLFNKQNVRAIKYLVDNTNIYKKPCILIAAGPSLDKNISLLKNNQNKFLIFCADVVLFRLVEEGIKPDFVCSIDPNPSIVRFWNNIDTKDLKLIAPTTTSPEVLKFWKGSIFLFNQYDSLNEQKRELLNKLTVPTQNYGFVNNMFFVGATLLQVSLVYKPSSLYLLGYDFSFTDDKAYCQGFLDRKLIDTENVGMDLLKSRELNYDKEVDGVKTTNQLLLYKKTFVQLSSQVTNSLGIPIVNCTEGGILNELPLDKLENVNSLYFESINKNLLGKPRVRRGKK